MSRSGSGDDQDSRAASWGSPPDVLIDARLHEQLPSPYWASALGVATSAAIAPMSPMSQRVSRAPLFLAWAADHSGYSASAAVRHLRSVIPSIGIVVLSDRPGLSSPEKRHLSRAGADWLLFLHHPSTQCRLRELMRQRLSTPAPARALRQVVAMDLPPGAAALVAWTLRNACYRPSESTAAAVFRTTPKTITRTLRRHGVPLFRLLKGLGLLLHASEAEARFGLTRAQIGRRLGFRDGSRLSRLSAYWSRPCSPNIQLEAWLGLIALYRDGVPHRHDMSSNMLSRDATTGA